MTRVAYVIGTYPRLTTTFIDREIRLLRARGIEIELVSLRRPGGVVSPEQQQVAAGTTYILPARPLDVVRTHLWAARQPAFWRVAARLLRAPHPSLRARAMTVAHLGEGVMVAAVLRGRGIERIHAHFVDRAAVVALTAARLLGVPYSATAHAADIYVSPVLLPEKLAEADFVATCTAYNEAHLAGVNPTLRPGAVVRVYHGLDVERYDPPARVRSDQPLLLAVGQLKPKKGFLDLLEACATLQRRGRSFRCTIVGEGPQRDELERRIAELGLGEIVELTGALRHDEVIDRYRAAELFVLPCVTGDDGDRDGLPNVILEAMAMELPVVSTDHSAVGEAVVDGVTGRLVAPHDPAGLADALDAFLIDPELRERFGRAGRKVVLEQFTVGHNVSSLHRMLSA